MQADEVALALRPGSLDRLGGEVVHLGGGADALRDVASAVVHLQEQSAVAAAGGRAAVPDVGDEQRDVARVRFEQDQAAGRRR